MNANPHRECYGKMAPDLEHLNYNAYTDGKAFRVFAKSNALGPQLRELTVKPEAWDECTACPEYPSCYDLSMARVGLQAALAMR